LKKKISTPEKNILLTAKWIDKKHDSFVIQLSWSDDSLSFAELLHLAGVIPLPPYIKRQTEQSDEERYQTIYAQHEGSVAAPTAGLHFTSSIFDSLKAREINSDFVTLHVGAGTFKPVKSETMAGHEMHAEFIEVNLKTIENIFYNIHKPIIPVGTTSLRAIETLYWMGVKVSQNGQPRDLSISQWEPYETRPKNMAAADAMRALIDYMKGREMDKIISRTQILIAPGYQARLATALVTNFHQPQSTLLLLVAALIGNDWKKVYDYALNNDFRFLSYGDGSLLFFNDQAGTADIAG
jgi:S-adenosylmethionine:tRNA ribosyltransferase-isomerase